MVSASLPYEVVLVDDGSSDGTLEVLHECKQKYPLTIVRHERNCGLAATIRDGLLEALRRAADADVVVTMDADGTHPPDLILRMMEMIHTGCDVVVASRFQPGATVYGVPFHRRILSLGASHLCRTLFPTQGVRDFTCGYRAFRASLLQEALRKYGDHLFDAEGFCCTLDLLLKLRRLKAVFEETPITLRYDLKAGKSKMHVGQTIFGTLVLLVRRRMGF
jgi:dolichol-phosphate mannosyltransferase